MELRTRKDRKWGKCPSRKSQCSDKHIRSGQRSWVEEKILEVKVKG